MLYIRQNRVRELRLGKELSQSDRADHLGVSRQTVNAIETERYTPSLPLAIALAPYFESTVGSAMSVWAFRPD
jgi:putative transcriptional regulator